jgi:hypothetical protein
MQLAMRPRSIQGILQIICLIFVLFLGIFLRFATADGTIVDHPVRNDGRDYIAYAWNLKSFDVYSKDFSTVNQSDAARPLPDAYRPPGYPLVLRALLHDRVDPDFWVRTVHVQAWIACLTLACSLWLAIKVLGTWPGLLTGLLVATSPHQSAYVSYFLTETLYGLLLIAALSIAVISLTTRSPKWRYVWSGATGVLFATTCLVRPTLNQWIPFLLLLLSLRQVRCFHREILICAVAFFVAMAPWWVRNATSTHQLSDGAQMMITVQQGTYPDFMYQADPNTLGYPYAHDPAAGAASTSWGNLFSYMRLKFAGDPLGMLKWYAVGKTAYFFHWTTPEGWHDMFIYPILRSPWLSDPFFILITALMRGLYSPLIICGLLGTVAAFLPKTVSLFGVRDADALRVLALLHFFAIGVHVLGAPFARYSVPFRPLTFLLAIFFLCWVVRNYSAMKELRTVAPQLG